ALVVAQSDRNMVLDPTGPVANRSLVHRRPALAGAYRCLHRNLQPDSTAIRLDQKEGPSTQIQKPPYHPSLIPGTSLAECNGLGREAAPCSDPRGRSTAFSGVLGVGKDSMPARSKSRAGRRRALSSCRGGAWWPWRPAAWPPRARP